MGTAKNAGQPCLAGNRATGGQAVAGFRKKLGILVRSSLFAGPGRPAPGQIKRINAKPGGGHIRCGARVLGQHDRFAVFASFLVCEATLDVCEYSVPFFFATAVCAVYSVISIARLSAAQLPKTHFS